jgi:alpha-L-rhamnosidase
MRDCLPWAVVSQRPLFHLVFFALIGFSLSFGREGTCQEEAASRLRAPTELRCAGRAEPVIVQNGKPDLSWQVTSVDDRLHGVSQSSYEVRIARRDADLVNEKSVLWDSGQQAGSATKLPARVYSGPEFESGREYSWQVRVWDEMDRPSPWSQPAHWRQEPIWRAQWIAAATDVEADERPLPLLRKAVSVNGNIRQAILYISGLGQYEFRINGTKVGDSELAPGWSDYRKTVFYDTYDVTHLLRSGTNVLGVLLGNGMYDVPKTPGRYTKFNGSFGPPKCIVQLEVELSDNRVLSFLSDGTWKAHPGPITFSNTYGGEDYDARLEPVGWDLPGFDDSAWKPALVTDGPGGALRPELAPPIRVMHTYAPVAHTEPKPGILVYDLGQNFAGWPLIEVRGAAGSTIKLIPGELLNEDGTVSQRSSGGPQWFSYTLKGRGTEEWHPRFSYYGFRYVQVEGAAASGDVHSGNTTAEIPRLKSLAGQAVHSSAETVGHFSSSDDLLNRIHTLIVRAIENNAESLFTDCPHREKLGWLEETHLLASSMLYDFEFSGLYAATARNIADTQAVNGPQAGRVSEIAPQYVLFEPQWGPFDDSPEWGSAAVLAPWYVYQRNGDREAVLSQLPVMKRYVDYLSTRAQDNIIAYGLGDWFDIGPGEPGISKLTTPGVTATAIYYQDLRILEAVLAFAGRKAESAAYGAKADAVRKSFNQRFFDAKQHRYDKGSQTAQAMPLVVGLVPAEETAQVLAALVADIRAHGNHVTAGDVGYHYVVNALLDGGRSDVLYDMLERKDSPSYGYQLTQGATSLTEAWDANPRSSQDHFMLGHAEEWFYRGLGGIGVDFSAEPPKQLTIAPQVVGNLDWVQTSYSSRWGLIKSSFKRGPEETEYEITIPSSTTATATVLTSMPDAVKINGQQPADAAGVVKSTRSKDRIDLVVNSGSYRIVAQNPTKKE